jgi:hypothetical protein
MRQLAQQQWPPVSLPHQSLKQPLQLAQQQGAATSAEGATHHDLSSYLHCIRWFGLDLINCFTPCIWNIDAFFPLKSTIPSPAK